MWNKTMDKKINTTRLYILKSEFFQINALEQNKPINIYG